ncbi:MAG: pyruvate kinase [Candidatus Margulisiibacteriota bacterium]|jgi:pyruvate kinase
MRKTKIVCTLGPAVDDPEILKKLLQAGMNVARFNLSHGTYEEHEKRLQQLRKLSPNMTILVDLQGPRIRTGSLREKSVELKTGELLTLTTQNIAGDAKIISISPGTILPDIKAGDLILLADGAITLKVAAKRQSNLECQIVEGGVIGEHKGVNLPHTKLNLPSLTAKDRKDLEWGIKQGADFFALSFVRKQTDILELKKLLKKSGIPVIAKIEKPEAIENLESIIAVADGVMVARGDLGVELSLEKVPIIQKDIIELCRLFEKPVIVATQMLESMIKEPNPTRAEVSDVANAIFDGTDAVMLSAETSIGRYPAETVEMMARIAEEAETRLKSFATDITLENKIDTAVAHAAGILAKVMNAKAIVTFTETGSTALRVSKQRPEMPILGVVTNDRAFRRLALYFGVRSIRIDEFKTIDEMIMKTQKAIETERLLKKDDLVVITAGIPVHIPGTTNLIKVHRLGEKITL